MSTGSGRKDDGAVDRPRGFLNTRTGTVLLCAASLLAVVTAALLWYPPLTSAAYQPVAASQPFFEEAEEDLVNINLATAPELAVLPGIGEVKAQAIVAWREENGPFTSVQQLLEVKGIGEKTLEGLTPYICL